MAQARLVKARIVKIGGKHIYSKSLRNIGKEVADNDEYVKLIEALRRDTPMDKTDNTSSIRQYRKVYLDLSILKVDEDSMLVMLGNINIGVSIRCNQSGKVCRLLTYVFFYVYVLFIALLGRLQYPR